MLVDAFLQNYTTNVDILKARLKAARQQHNQDFSAFLCDIRTLARRAYRAFPHLVEQIVLTSFIERLSDSTLRRELRKSKPATADDALALAMELNSFLEIEKGAPSTSKMAETSVNAMYRETPEPPTKEWMDELARTPTEVFKNAMTKPNQEDSRQRNSTPNRNQLSRSNSTDFKGTRTVRFQKDSNGGGNTNNRDSNCRGSNRQITNSNRRNDNKNGSKGPCKHCKRDNHASNECKACFKCGKEKIQNISTLKSRKSPKLTDKKDAKYDSKLVKNSIDTGISLETKTKFSKLINEFSDVFSKNEWDIGQCDVTAHKIQVEPGSRPIKLPNKRMPLHYKDDLQENIDAFLEKS